jgi:lysophospholipase L1-like esterase
MGRRLLILSLIGLCLIAAGWAVRYFWLVLPMGEGPAGPPVAREPFQATWSTRKVLLVGIGDSVTAGWGVPQTHSYFGRLAKNPSDELPDMRGICLGTVLPNLKAENIAVSGSTSFDHVEHIRDRLATQDTDTLGIVVMTTGGNDLIHNYGRTPPREGAAYGATLEQAQPWIGNFERRLDTMVDMIEARFPGGCHIFLADIYDPTDGLGTPGMTGLPPWPDVMKIHQAYNDVIHRCAERRASVRLVPMHDAFLGHGIHCRQFWREHYRADDPHYWFAFNLEDPNLRGYDAIRRLFLIEIAKVAGEFKRQP